MNRIPLLVSLALALPASCQACATVTPATYESGLPPEIDITSESALIVWDAKSNTEQFVRRADFQTKAKNFGFLVPTPSKPELAVAQDKLFYALERELMPRTKIVAQQGINWTPLLGSIRVGGPSEDSYTAGAAGNTASTDDANAVEVVEQKRVGNYNATVLRANDSNSLIKWLHAHHYAATTDTRHWLEPYVKVGFYLTAFQIIAEAQSNSAQAQSVRLTFKSTAPFYPYREPERAQKQGGGRTLRVFFVGDKRVQAHIEDKTKSEQWPAELEYSGQLEPRTLREQGIVPAEGILRLSAFEDFSSPRPGWGDLRFEASSDQSEKTPPPVIVYKDRRIWLPLDVLVVGAALMIGFGVGRFKRGSM